MNFPWMLDKTSFDPLLNNAENLADSKNTGFELKAVNQKLLFPMADGSIPMFTKEVMNNVDAIEKLNKLEPPAGEYMRSTLEWVENFKKYGFLDMDECRKLKDNYQAVIMRFFEGYVPRRLIRFLQIK